MQSFVAEGFFSQHSSSCYSHAHTKAERISCHGVQLVCATDAKNPRPDPRLEDMLGRAVSTCLVTVAMSQLGDSSGL